MHLVLLCGAAVWCCCVVLLCGAAVWCCCVVLLCGAAVWCCCVVLLCGAAVWFCCVVLLRALPVINIELAAQRSPTGRTTCGCWGHCEYLWDTFLPVAGSTAVARILSTTLNPINTLLNGMRNLYLVSKTWIRSGRQPRFICG